MARQPEAGDTKRHLAVGGREHIPAVLVLLKFKARHSLFC